MTIKDNLNQIKTYKTDIKNAIINKGISMTGVPLSGYASKITAISCDYIDVRNKLGDYYYSTRTSIPEYTFVGCYNLKSISLPNCTTIGSSAFTDCYNLSKGGLSFVSLPKCKSVYLEAFYFCRSIYYADLPVCTARAGRQASARGCAGACGGFVSSRPQGVSSDGADAR